MKQGGAAAPCLQFSSFRYHDPIFSCSLLALQLHWSEFAEHAILHFHTIGRKLLGVFLLPQIITFSFARQKRVNSSNRNNRKTAKNAKYVQSHWEYNSSFQHLAVKPEFYGITSSSKACCQGFAAQSWNLCQVSQFGTPQSATVLSQTCHTVAFTGLWGFYWAVTLVPGLTVPQQILSQFFL